jgi:hypothetical protein
LAAAFISHRYHGKCRRETRRGMLSEPPRIASFTLE